MEEAAGDVEGVQRAEDAAGEVGLAELQAGDVDCDWNERDALTFPLVDLHADVFEDPLAEGKDEAALFGDGDED